MTLRREKLGAVAVSEREGTKRRSQGGRFCDGRGLSGAINGSIGVDGAVVRVATVKANNGLADKEGDEGGDDRDEEGDV